MFFKFLYLQCSMSSHIVQWFTFLISYFVTWSVLRLETCQYSSFSIVKLETQSMIVTTTSISELVSRVYPKKQKQVVLHVLPLLWHLLGATNSSGAVQGGRSSIRTATGKLVNSLYNYMGPQLIERASADPNVTPRHIQLLQELAESWESVTFTSIA